MRKLWVFAFLIACEHGKGGGPGPGSSGLPENALVGELDGTEVEQLCSALVQQAPEPHTINCPDGNTVEVGESTLSDCTDSIEQQQDQFVACGLTVGEYETCVEAILDLSDAERCEEALPPECDVLLECSNVPTDDDPPPPEPQPGG
jgi:hypothetical protein